MLDGEILRLMLRAAGVPAADARRLLPGIMRTAQNLYVRRCPELTAKVCPGVPELLAALGRRGAILGLVTGNLSRIGWRKMTRAGLRRHFRFGAFAEEGPTRAALARLAVRKARAEGLIPRGAPCTLVGDHPNDILAARAAGLRVVATATGVVPYKELALCSPDILVADLRSLDPESLLCPGGS
jgi:phosphoglycolate phosphatase-like HAD superfamily hydrolase